MKLELNKVYIDREGNQWKVILYKKEHLHPFTAINKAQDHASSYKENGTYRCVESACDLIGLVGDDFKKEPIKIEFEGSILWSDANRDTGRETITLSPHKRVGFSFEITKALNKPGAGVHNCKITIEEIVE